jgi:hypothetical protein
MRYDDAKPTFFSMSHGCALKGDRGLTPACLEPEYLKGKKYDDQDAEQTAQFTALLSGPQGLKAQIDAAGLVSVHANEPSQWETVAADGQGNPCLLAEVSAGVRCLDKDLKRLLASFRLDPSVIGELDKSWREEPNSRGEGMILLQRGHLLVLKEKKPSLLVEFGPKREGAIGYGPDTFLKQGEAFVYPVQGRLVALKVWEFAGSLSKLARDGSDITLGRMGASICCPMRVRY